MMPGRILGYIRPVHIPQQVRTILKIKEDTLISNLPLSFCKDNKIDPDNLIFDVIQDSNKIMLVAQREPLRTEPYKPTPTKMKVANVG